MKAKLETDNLANHLEIKMKAWTVLVILTVASGCATVQPPSGPPALSTDVRDQIGHLAIRGPRAPKVSLTTDLDGKGAAAGKTAVAAGTGWLGGTMEAASQSADEGAALVMVMGLMATPFVAAGGAMYGAAAADSEENGHQGQRGAG